MKLTSVICVTRGQMLIVEVFSAPFKERGILSTVK